MANEIKTKSIGFEVVKVKDFILCEKPMSRLVFRPLLYREGIKGKIIRQRRVSKDDNWIPEKSINIRQLKKDESISVELSTEAVKELYSAMQKLEKILEEKGIEYGERTYTVADPSDLIITEKNKSNYIKKILEKGYSKDIWKNLVEQDPSLATKLSYARIQVERQKVVEELKSRLKPNFTIQETSGDNSWQKWIYKNNWLFGINYKKPIEKTKINIQGIMPDYLFPTIDGFVDILEIKLPNDQVIVKDTNHSGAWKWTPKTNEAIGQMVNYLGEIDRLRLEIERSIKNRYGYKISLLKPRGYILIGDSSQWLDEKKEGLRKMNHALHGIEILTYKDLVDRGESIVQLNSKNK